MKNREELLINLIFGNETTFEINCADYIVEIYKYDKFMDEIKVILKKSGVKIVKEKLELDIKGPIWTIKVKK